LRAASLSDKLQLYRIAATMNILEKVFLTVRVAIRSRRVKAQPGTSRIIGLTGRAETAIAPVGTVFLRNELWRACSDSHIDRGATVRVTGLAGLTLCVDPVTDFADQS
jgi:membrane-bound ClpP family serine protease